MVRGRTRRKRDIFSLPTYVINLNERKDRWKRFLSQPAVTTFSRLRRFPAVNGKRLNYRKDKRISVHTRLNITRNYRRSHYEIATLGAVGSSMSHVGVWRKFVAENKVETKAVDVFFTTPPFFNYNWSVHADMPADLREKIKAALLALNPANPEHAEILKLNRATRYVPTTPENYKGLETAARSAGLL